jgi:hypothetical protein
MGTELTWRVSLPTSYLHAAVVAEQVRQFADRELADVLAEPVQALIQEATDAGIDSTALLSRLAALSVDVDGTRRLVEMAMVKIAGQGAVSSGLVERLAGRIIDLDRAFQAAHPDALDVLQLRTGPLRLAWEAYGPGVLRQIGALTEEGIIVSRAVVAVVHPALGGAGAAHLDYNSVRIEGVLANPHEQLPEPLRLAWLLAQLNMDVPLYSDLIPADRRAQLAGLAMIPAVLAAAAELGLTGISQTGIEQALEWWHLAEHDVGSTANAVFDWWQTYQNTKPSWSVALAALDRMLAEVPSTLT